MLFVLIVRFVTKLLTDLAHFVTDTTNSDEDPLCISCQNPDRDRQKLMREQNILQEVHILNSLVI